jgi:hypothetical protein
MFLITGLSYAQKSAFRFSMNNINAIKQDGKVVGYHALLEVKKQKDAYKLMIYDTDMELVAEKEITNDGRLNLLESSYNGSHLCFKLHDMKSRKMILKFYDNEANLTGEHSTKLSIADEAGALMGTAAVASIHPIKGKGFVEYKVVVNKKPGYQITFYANDGKEQWTIFSDPKSKLIQFASYLYSSGDFLISSVNQQSGYNMNKVNISPIYSIVDINSGKVVNEINISKDSKQTELFTTAFENNADQLSLIGYYGDGEESLLKSETKGLVIKTLDRIGNIVDTRYLSWEEDVKKYLPLSNVGYLFFHDFVQLEDNRIIGVGESFKEVAGKEIEIKDIYFFEFDKDFSLLGVDKVETKEQRSNQLLKSAGPVLSASLAKLSGDFTFSHITMNVADPNKFSVFYMNKKEEKDEKKLTNCGRISFSDGEYIREEINVPNEADDLKILPAQENTVLFVEYYKKEKNLQMNLKSFNH